MLIDKTRCAKRGLAPINFTYIQGQSISATAIFPNDILQLYQPQNTLICPQKGAECEPEYIVELAPSRRFQVATPPQLYLIHPSLVV